MTYLLDIFPGAPPGFIAACRCTAVSGDQTAEFRARIILLHPLPLPVAWKCKSFPPPKASNDFCTSRYDFVRSRESICRYAVSIGGASTVWVRDEKKRVHTCSGADSGLNREESLHSLLPMAICDFPRKKYHISSAVDHDKYAGEIFTDRRIYMHVYI